MIEGGKLHLLYSKNAKLGAAAEVKTAVDLVHEGVITSREGITNTYAPLLRYLHHQIVDPKAAASAKLISAGISGSNAGATGHVVFDAGKIPEYTRQGKQVIFISKDNTAEHYLALLHVHGYITQYGGALADTSILMRERAIATVVSCPLLVINESKTECRMGSNVVKEGDLVTVDGRNGKVYEGAVPLIDVEEVPEYEELCQWADSYKRMSVLVNADNPEDVILGKRFGAEGIGLCKTEQMFNDPAKLKYIRKAILADNTDERKKVLEELEQYHKEDFKSLFKIMAGRRCIIRILDPPLNSFVPNDKAGQERLAAELGVPVEKVAQQEANLGQFNPTLGLRGSRLAAVYPEFLQFQVKSIFLAALEVIEEGFTPLPYIELPMISTVKEFLQIKHVIAEIAEETGALDKIKYKVGLLLEIPRAALTADELAHEADFIHFGTNDLTQLTCGFSREDSHAIIDRYVLSGAYAKDPFVSLDLQGVGQLMSLSVHKIRKAKKNLRIGVCGNHAADLASIDFCQQIGIDEISCVAANIPVAKIAAAQAELKFPHKP